MESQRLAGRPLLVVLNGAQGSGKTTVSDYLCTSLFEEHGLNAVALSLDDFYLTRLERKALAVSVHPLLATRGVPGTHDMSLLRRSLDQLLDVQRNEPVAIPRFNKATDDRFASSDWALSTSPVHLVLLEGWCLGAQPQAADNLSRPINDLERDEDPTGVWRSFSNEVLRCDFKPLYALVDQWVMLCAPSFDCVLDWRKEQERKLAASIAPDGSSRLMDDDALQKFVQHFERLTRSCIGELPGKVNHLLRLDENRQVTAYTHHLKVINKP